MSGRELFHMLPEPLEPFTGERNGTFTMTGSASAPPNQIINFDLHPPQTLSGTVSVQTSQFNDYTEAGQFCIRNEDLSGDTATPSCFSRGVHVIHSGVVTVRFIYRPTPACSDDLNGDGHVNLPDLAILLTHLAARLRRRTVISTTTGRST